MADVGYTGTPESNDLITRLMGVLEKNRAERQNAEQQQARYNAASGFMAGLKGAQGGKKDPGPAAAAEKPEPLVKPGEPQVRPAAAGGNSAARVGIGKKYIDTKSRENELLSSNPYSGFTLKENDTPGPVGPDPAREEQKKRFTQQLMLNRGQTGGPLGAAGQRPPPEALVPTPEVPDFNATYPTPQQPVMEPPAQGGGFPQPQPPNLAMLDWAAARGGR